MREERIKVMTENATGLGENVVRLVDALNSFTDENGQSFTLNEQVPGIDSNTAQVIGRIQSSVGLIADFDKIKQADMVPLRSIDGVDKAVAGTEQAATALMQLIDNLTNNQGGLKGFNYSNFHAQTNNGQSHNIQTNIKQLYDATELLLLQLFNCIHIFKPRAAFGFHAAASSLSTLISDANDKLGEIKSLRHKLAETEAALNSKKEEAEAQVGEIARLKSEGAADRKTMADYLAEVTQQSANVNAINNEAGALQPTVKNYQQQFDQFQEQLDARETTFNEGTKKIDDLTKRFEGQRDTVKDLISRSEQMLSSATVSGLASNFGKMQEKLTAELTSARNTFYLGIGCLAISAIPLLLFIIMPVLAALFGSAIPGLVSASTEIGANAPQNGWQYVGQVLARVAFLLPAAWFVSFAAIRHSSLFRLREHYAYKYSMAVSVQGFKQQAPKYEQEIAALVLEQLAFNPADKLVPSKEVQEGRAPGIAGYLLSRLRGQSKDQQ